MSIPYSSCYSPVGPTEPRPLPPGHFKCLYCGRINMHTDNCEGCGASEQEV